MNENHIQDGAGLPHLFRGYGGDFSTDCTSSLSAESALDTLRRDDWTAFDAAYRRNQIQPGRTNSIARTSAEAARERRLMIQRYLVTLVFVMAWLSVFTVAGLRYGF